MNKKNLITGIIILFLLAANLFAIAQNATPYSIWKDGKVVGTINRNEKDSVNINPATKKVISYLSNVDSISFNTYTGTTLGEKNQLFLCTEKLDNPYGVCAHIGFFGIDYQLRDKELSRMNEAEIGYYRTNFEWNSLQSSSATPINWTQLDALMKSTRDSKVKVLPIICGALASENYRPPTEYLDKWNTFTAALVNRYRDVPAWEVINEPNFNSSFPAETYTALLKSTYQTIKSNNPNATVVLGGIGELDPPYMKNLSAAKAYDYFDVMNFHTYNDWNTPEQLIMIFRDLQKIMADYKWNKPVWITEVGYTTAPNTIDMEEKSGAGFFSEVLPQIFQTKLNINPANSTIGLLSDPETLYIGAGRLNPELYCSQFADYRYITHNDLKTLNPEEVPVLIVTVAYGFPTLFLDALENYVRKGGTLVFGKNSFGEEFSPDPWGTVAVSDYAGLCRRLHIKISGWWEMPDRPSNLTWQQPAAGFNFNYRWNYSNAGEQSFLTGNNLKSGDELIPVMQTGGGNFTGTVIGLYKLNSDLKGNIIIQTRAVDMPVWGYGDSGETVQAQRLPRNYLISFAFGIDKVFWYALHTGDGEFTPENREYFFGIFDKNVVNPKPAYYAYKTLTTMCPDKSTRPVLTEKEGVYLATWAKPNGVKVAAIWTPMAPLKVKLKVSGNAKYYEHVNGTEIQADPNDFTAKPGITYIVGADISFL